MNNPTGPALFLVAAALTPRAAFHQHYKHLNRAATTLAMTSRADDIEERITGAMVDFRGLVSERPALLSQTHAIERALRQRIAETLVYAAASTVEDVERIVASLDPTGGVS